MTAITAVTCQNTTGVKSIVPMSSSVISKQIEFTSKDIKPDGVKIGMLQSQKIINAVLNSLKKIKIGKVVLDPVMVSKSGTKLINEKAIKDIKKKLFKKIFLITPNIPEAELLTNTKIKSVEKMIIAGKILIKAGAKNVLIKGGHLKSKKIYDVLINKKQQKYMLIKNIAQKYPWHWMYFIYCYYNLFIMWKNLE